MTPQWTRVQSLEPTECMRLLTPVRWGRVAWMSTEGPQVLPVNHTVGDGAIVFRTDLYSTIADATGAGTIAYQADELDDLMREGWSVLMVGQAHHVEDPAEMRRLWADMGEPWAPGSRPLIVRIVPTRISGRRFYKG